jgi:hypothetical protein
MEKTRITTPGVSGPVWSDECPTTTGRYLFRCGETAGETETLEISRPTKKGGMVVACPHLGVVPLSTYHDGLTKPQWSRIARGCRS